MDNSVFTSYQVDDRSYLSYVKREIHNQLTQEKFSSLRTGEIDIIVSELTSNLIKYAASGELIYRFYGEGDQRGFEIFCLDNGHGTNSMMQMMRDGTSTSNTLGQGLGSISRLSDFFQIYSSVGSGTVAYSRSCKVQHPPAQSREVVDIRPIQICIPGEKVCGDGYYIKKTKSHTQIFLGDGLGHGPHAHEAVSQGIEAFKLCPDIEPSGIMRYIHQHAKKTRGLVGTVAVLDHAARSWQICGIGNISTRLYQGIMYKTYMPNNGILGMNIPNTINNFSIPAENFQWIIMHSDGVRTRWDLTKYPSLLKYDPAIMSAVIFKDNARRNDDMTVLAGKVNL